MPESKLAKARRLILERPVRVLYAGAFGFRAEVRGDSGVYVAEWDGAFWRCTCPYPSRTTVCSHIAACRMIWLPPDEREGERPSAPSRAADHPGDAISRSQ